MNSLPAKDLALKHILESGVKLVEGQAVEEPRRTNVLKALVKIFADADKGSQALSTRNFFMAAEEPPVIERFTLFFRHLHRSIGSDLSARLSEAASVMKSIEETGHADAAAQVRVAGLLRDLLAGIAQESALTPLVSQKEVLLSF